MERGSKRGVQGRITVFQLLCLVRTASWKLIFADVNHSGNSPHFQDLKLAVKSLILMKPLQIHRDIVKAKFGLKTVNLSNDSWTLVWGYMAVNQGVISSIQRKQVLKRFGNVYYQVEILKERAWVLQGLFLPLISLSAQLENRPSVNVKVLLFISDKTVPFCQIALFQRKNHPTGCFRPTILFISLLSTSEN